MENNMYPFVNLPLPYAFDALEPYIDTKTMEIHHDRQLQAYINQLNRVLSDFPVLQSMTLEELIINADELTDGLSIPIRNYGGGVYNHRFYFNGMQPPSDLTPRGRLIEMINAQYGNFYNFQEVVKREGLSVFGSGYAWLVFDDGRLRVITTPNQNCPLEQGLCPILALDVWEHAYFLKHYNLRGNYIDDWFRVINWEKADENYLNCIQNYQEMGMRRRK
ncbi:superoxide dismutase [Anaerotignum neopropionicum]|uniref:Superoxide dismutase n=1 Tax=Anaerotignum neopropionicum TaxID=36847 RepID=A0A136WFY1_9FIRM|nr:superoxide dismutase [Anaerotignum neopropionicum]KXL53431.1 superoxide dismutase [Anaerotignum neopropionicum]